MKLKYDVYICVACGTEYVACDEDYQFGDFVCPKCGYTNEFIDPRLEKEEEEW